MKNFKKTTCIVMSMMLALTVAPNPAQAASKAATVATQKALNSALKNNKITKITIKTDKSVSLKIGSGSYSAKTLTVKAGKAAITNSGSFKSVSIADAKSFTEKASENKITVTDDKLKLTVGKASANDTLVFNKKDATITVILNGTPASIKNLKDAALNVTNNTASDVAIIDANGGQKVVKPVNAVETPAEDTNTNNTGANDNNNSNVPSTTPNNDTSNNKPNTNEAAENVVGKVIISNILYQDGKVTELTAVQGTSTYHLTEFINPITESFNAYEIVKVYVRKSSTSSAVYRIDKADVTTLPDQTIDIYSIDPVGKTFTANETNYTVSTSAINTIGMIKRTDSGVPCVTPITFADLATLSANNKVTISSLGSTGYVDTILVTVD